MPKIDLTLTMSWEALEVETLESVDEDNRGKEYTVPIYFDGKTDYELAMHMVKTHYLPEGWHEVLRRLPAAQDLDINVRPTDRLCRAQFLIEMDPIDNIEAAKAEWLNHTFPAWIQHLKDKNPDARGLPTNKREPDHLKFSARRLMAMMDPLEIHDVLYSDNYECEWTWKQKLLHTLQPCMVREIS